MRYYYPEVTGDPPLYWVLDTAPLPAHELRQSTTERGDTCHHDILGLTEKQARDFFLPYSDRLENFRRCHGSGDSSPMTIADITGYPPHHPVQGEE